VEVSGICHLPWSVGVLRFAYPDGSGNTRCAGRNGYVAVVSGSARVTLDTGVGASG